MSLFTLTIHGGRKGLAASFGETDQAHHAEISRLLAHASRELQSGSATRGDLIDANGAPVGEWHFNKSSKP